MEFFKSLAEAATEKLQLAIAVTIQKETAVVTVTPKAEGGTAWTPFVMRGRPEELDQEFEKQVEKFKEAAGIIANASDYMEKIKKEAAEKTKGAVKKEAALEKAAIPQKKEEKAEPKKEEKKAEPKKAEPKKEEPKAEEEGLEIF